MQYFCLATSTSVAASLAGNSFTQKCSRRSHYCSTILHFEKEASIPDTASLFCTEGIATQNDHLWHISMFLASWAHCRWSSPVILLIISWFDHQLVWRLWDRVLKGAHVDKLIFYSYLLTTYTRMAQWEVLWKEQVWSKSLSQCLSQQCNGAVKASGNAYGICVEV